MSCFSRMSRFARIGTISVMIVAVLVAVVVGASVWLGVGLSGGSPDHGETPQLTGDPGTAEAEPDTTDVDVTPAPESGDAAQRNGGAQRNKDGTLPEPDHAAGESTSAQAVESTAIPGPDDTSEIPDLTPQPGEHPMFRVLTWAKRELPRVEAITDYSATFTKQEQLDGEVGDPVRMFLKMRQNPVSIYVRYEEPSKDAGVEAIYVEAPGTPAGRGKMWGHGTGMQRMFGTLELDPNGVIAMHGQRYPISTIGILKMLRLFIEVGSKELAYGECEVTYTPETIWKGRRCAEIVVVHPVKRDYFRFHRAIVRVDRELVLPVFYASYDWEKDRNGQLKLQESYSYENVKLNNGFTDADFSTKNSSYHFP
ncbi:MAG: DUF1571 domain-containing protein [Planctomycetia bacterium]|nr:DUF1571 domain-containing protein [Planctomycetia bacterium]